MGTSAAFDLGDPCTSDTFTPAALIALRDAGGLVPNCHYFVDITHGNLGATVAELHATDTNVLSQDCKINTVFDNSAWHGVLDLDAGFYQEVHDQRGNVVRDFATGATIAQFPWGSTAFINNQVENSLLTGWTAPVGANRFNGNIVYDANVNLTAWTSGTIAGNTIRGGGAFDTTALTAAATTTLSRCSILDAAVTLLGTGNHFFTDTDFSDIAAFTTDATSAVNVTATGSVFDGGFVARILNKPTGAVTFIDSRFHGAHQAGTDDMSLRGPGNCSFVDTEHYSRGGATPDFDFDGTGIGASIDIAGLRSRGTRFIRTTPSTTTLMITDCVFDGGTVNIDGNTGSSTQIQNIESINTTFNIRGSARWSVTSGARLAATLVTSVAGCTGGFNISGGLYSGGTLTMNRLVGGAVTALFDCHMAGSLSQINDNGTTDPGPNVSLRMVTLKDSVLTIGNYAGLIGAGIVVQQAELLSGTLIISGGPASFCQDIRVHAGSLNNNGFGCEGVIIDGYFTKVLTANNINRLCNKGFDDVV